MQRVRITRAGPQWLYLLRFFLRAPLDEDYADEVPFDKNRNS